MVRIFGLVAGGVMLAGVAQAAVLTVDTYSQTNNVYNQNYYDQTYAGPNATGNVMGAGSFLQGGKGKLTDGIVPGVNFYQSPAIELYGTALYPYVGYGTVNPAFVFTFASPVTINSISFAVDDSGGTGGVTAPLGAFIDSVYYAFTNPDGPEPFIATVSGLNLTAASVPITIMAGGFWTFVSEITFEGTASAVPEPGSMALLGVGLLGLLRRRKAG